MSNMFKDYDDQIKKALSSEEKREDWKEILEEHKAKVTQIQHERLIHLLVTMTVCIAMVLCVLTTIITSKASLLYLDFPLIALFTAYILHYRFLENTTQSWYKLTDRIKEKI